MARSGSVLLRMMRAALRAGQAASWGGLAPARKPPRSRAAKAGPSATPKRTAPSPPRLGRVSEVTTFGTNPGALRMLVYSPPRRPAPGAPLIVVLHGCKQSAADFATAAGWVHLAGELGIPLLLPEQRAENNPYRCFNWFKPGDTGRGRGEALSIRQMVRSATALFGSDPRRVFIVGLSAGGAMAAGMLAAYPATFAAGAVVAGMPVGAANTSHLALLRMHRADPFGTRAGLAASVRARSTLRGDRAWPGLSIWQGGQDRTVDPANADLLAAQWSALHGFGPEPTTDTAPAPGTRRRTWSRAAQPAVELWTIEAMAHGFPVHPALRGGGTPGAWVLDAGVPAARRIAEFWRLGDGAG